MEKRIYQTAEHVQISLGEPTRSVVMESPDAVVVMWCLLPGQQIAPHVHPAGQDTWTVLFGSADYLIDVEGSSLPLGMGQVAVARAGEVHGAINRGTVPFAFVSVVAPFAAGYELVTE